MSGIDNEDRLFQVNRFLQEICLCPYLRQSPEFRLFVSDKPMKDYETDFLTIPGPQTTTEYLDCLKPYFSMQGCFTDE